MVDAVVEQMKRDGVKTVAYIGFSDAWGDLVYEALMKATEPAGIKVLANERYARADRRSRARCSRSSPPARRGDDGRRRYARGAALPGAGRARLQGRRLRPARDDQCRLRSRGRGGGDGLSFPRGRSSWPSSCPTTTRPRRSRSSSAAPSSRSTAGRSSDAFSAYSFDGYLVFADAAARALEEDRGRNAGVPRGAARRDRQHRGSGRHARRLQLRRATSTVSTSVRV